MQIEEIKFKAKYKVSYLNGKYVLSGFNHLKSLHLNENELTEVLLSDITGFSQEDWEGFVQDYSKIFQN